MKEKYTILIIDDEEVVRDSCLQILTDGDYRLETASDGTEGLKKLDEAKPDLVFVDLKMPGISGFEILDKIGQLDPTIVSIVITGYATVSTAVEAMKKGAYDFLPKPFTPDEFRLITRRGLEKRKLVLETIALRREKEILRENFITIVSHELKAPLSAIQQNLIVMLGGLIGKLTFEQRLKLENMKSRIDSLIRLIHTWLKITSIDLRKIRDNFKPTQIPSLIEKAVENIQSKADSKNIVISQEIAGSLPAIYGEEGILIEALTNIIGNAVKYSHPEGKISIKAEENNKEILISVTDTGIGISKEDLPFIFDDFFRVRTSQDKEEGSGLGLAITRRIIEAHYGSIEVESELEKGSTFIIRLPGEKIEGENHSPQDFLLIHKRRHAMSQEKKLLIIDDDPDFVEGIKTILESAHYAVDVAYNPKAGFEALQSKPYDLLLLDIMMGRGAEGIMLARKLRNDVKLSQIPVLIITGIREQIAFLFPGEPVHPHFVPVDELVEKPVEPQFLLEKVETLIKLAESRKTQTK